MTTTATTSERDQAYFTIFVTALEGGIGYWSRCEEYHWSNQDGTEDIAGYFATVYDAERTDAEQEDRRFQIGKGKASDGEIYALFRIDRKVIARGVGIFLAKDWGSGTYFGRAQADLRRGKWGDLDVDADIADYIVQSGLFGEAIYG